MLGFNHVSLTIKRNRLRRSGHAEHKDDADWPKQCMKMEFEGTRQRAQPRKTWWDCINRDMDSFGLSRDDAQDRDHRGLKIKVETG